MPKTKKYPGILAKPIDLNEKPLGIDRNAFVGEEILKKIPALLDYCDIDDALSLEQKWCQIALKLARDHVPGFQIKKSKRKGAKRKWTLDENRALVDAIDAEKGTTGLKAAIRLAMKRPQWRWSRSAKDAASIQTRYHEAVSQIKRHKSLRNEYGPLGVLMYLNAPMPDDRPSRKRTTKKPG